jgi:YVTN family beta-propeller protein
LTWVIVALGLVPAPSGASGAGPASGLAPRLYTVMPSSEADEITGPSTVEIFTPFGYDLSATAAVEGLKPHHFAPVPGRNIALISHFSPTAFVEVFSLRKNAVVDTIPTGLGPRHLTFNRRGTVAYTANHDSNSVSALDTRSRRLIGTVPVGDEPNFVAFARTPHGPRVFACNNGSDTLTVIDARKLRVIRTIRVGERPFDMAMTHHDRLLASANAGDNTVSFVDTKTLRVVGTTPIGGVHVPVVPQKLHPRFTPNGRWLLVGNQDASVISVIDVPGRQLRKLIPAGLGADIAFFPPRGPAKGYALVTNRYDYFVTVLRLHGDRPPTPAKRIPYRLLGSHYVSFDRRYRRAFVSQRPGRAFSVLDLRTLTNAIDSVPVAPGGEGAPLHQSGPDQAIFVWFRHGQARWHIEER